jgi:hypothetical protein
VAAKARIVLAPGDTITFETPGGGGLGPPTERDAAPSRATCAEGYVTDRRQGVPRMTAPCRIGVDIGGTFTDFVLLDTRDGRCSTARC